MPFAGQVPAVGRTPFEVQRTIEQRLAEKAIEPQAIVTVAKSLSSSVTVTGEVVAGARIPLSVRGDRLLDVIAAAGGAKSPVYETFVRLSRGGVTATIPMERLVSNPAENIYAQPGDVLTLVRLPQSFTVFGAAGSNALVPFTAETDDAGRGAGEVRRPAGSARRPGRRLSVPLRTASDGQGRSAVRCWRPAPTR